jgi:hypothetical protein
MAKVPNGSFLLRVLLRDKGHVAALTLVDDAAGAFFDESMSAGKLPTTVVGGYVFEADSYLKFDSAMSALLNRESLQYFHMTDCATRNGQFKKFDREKCTEIEKELIELVRNHAALGVVAGVSEARFQLLQPVHHAEILGGSAYTMLCQWCLNEIGLWADRTDFKGRINYFFEAGNAHQTESNGALSRTVQDPQKRKLCRYGSHSFVDKMSIRGLQAADMLAWLFRKHIDEISRPDSEASRPPRKDFQALIRTTAGNPQVPEHRFKHFDDESLLSVFQDNSVPGLRWYG